MTGHQALQMKLIGLLLLLQICCAVRYKVGKNETFYRFDFTYPVLKVVNSSPPVKEGNCGTKDFCFQIFNASRGAIIEGSISKPVSTVVFYVAQSQTPRAIVFKQEGTNDKPNLPGGIKIIETVELDSKDRYHIEYLAIFEKDVEKITVSGDAQLATTPAPQGNLTVYSPLYIKDPALEKIIHMNGYIEETRMYFELQTTNGTSTREFLPELEYGAHYRGYYVTDFTGGASVKSLSWVLLGILFIGLFSM